MYDILSTFLFQIGSIKRKETIIEIAREESFYSKLVRLKENL